MKVLSRVFRGKFVEALRRAYDQNELDLAGGSEHLRDPAQWRAFVNALFETDWVVYAKPAFGGASAVLRYLGRYTHRVAISNHRLLAFDGDHVTFQWKDYAHGDQRRTMTLSAMEFLRRFVQHILPRGFVRIRQSGFSRTPVGRPAWRSRAPCSPHRRPPAVHDRDRADDHRPQTPRDVGLSALRSGDDRRPDPLGAPPGDGHTRLRYLMSTGSSSRPASSSTWSPTSPAAVCLDPRRQPVTSPRRCPHAPPARARAAAARAPTATSIDHLATPGDPDFQLHSRPPRQRLPSSLVIESASASASSYASSLSRRGTSDER